MNLRIAVKSKVFSRSIQLVFVSILVLFLASCGQQELVSQIEDQTPVIEPIVETELEDDVALFNDLDFENAEVETSEIIEIVEAEELEGIADGEVTELPAFEDAEDALTTQAVLPGASGYIYYIKYIPGIARPWRIYRHDQVSNARLHVYASHLPVQSVAGSADGKSIIISRKDSSAGDFEVYEINLSPLSIVKLTNNSVDDTNVSMSADSMRNVWQSKIGAKDVVVIRSVTGGSVSTVVLPHFYSQFQPSVSANGRYIALMRKVGSYYRVYRYDRAANNYLLVTWNKRLLSHPSPTDDGKKVAWLYDGFTLDIVRTKNLSSGAIVNVAASTSDIRHPHMKADGKWLTYGLERLGTNRIYTKNLVTGQKIVGTASFTPINYLGMYWQGTVAPALPDLVVTKASIKVTGTCEPYKAFLTVTATVKNIGLGPSPERLDVGLVNALETSGSGWGNGKGLPALAPGAEVTETFSIYYLISDPDHMPGAHVFDVKANRNNWIAESNTANNSYAPIKIVVPEDVCKPDLIVTKATIETTGLCAPYSPFLKVTATVKNIGHISSPERLDVGLINAQDTDGSGWGNGTGLPAIAPGDSVTETFNIYYLISDPDHMSGVHVFDVKANRGNWIAESDTTNNSYAPIKIDIPTDICGEETFTTDPEEGSSPDFKQLSVAYDGTDVTITIEYYEDIDITNAGDFVYLYDTNREVVSFGSSSFTVRRDNGADGHFEELLTSGTVTSPAARTLQMTFAQSHMTDIATKDIWAYSMTSLDRLPDAGVLNF